MYSIIVICIYVLQYQKMNLFYLCNNTICIYKIFILFPFFSKTTLIFIRITKNNATHRNPWPVESRPSNADYSGLQVYNWMQKKPPPSSPSQTSYTSRTRIYSQKLDFAKLPKQWVCLPNLSSNLEHVTWDTWLKKWRSSIHNKISKFLNPKIRHFRCHRTSFLQAV